MTKVTVTLLRSWSSSFFSIFIFGPFHGFLNRNERFGFVFRIAAQPAATSPNHNIFHSTTMSSTNNSDYLDELGLFNDGLISANDSDNDNSSVSVGVDDTADAGMEESGHDGDDPSSFAIPAMLPLSTTTDGGKQQMFLREEGIKDAPTPPSLTSAAAATPTAMAPSQRIAVLQSSKSNLQFRTDLSKSDRDSHPCGILHFKRVGHGVGRDAPEEHVFAWISHYHNPTHLDNTLLHMQRFGFFVATSSSEKKMINPNTNANTTVTFLPYSSRRSWIEKYPCAFPHVYCGENGSVSGYPYWSEGGGSDDMLRASSRGGRYYERMFQAINNHHFSNTSDDVGEAISSSAVGIASTISTAIAAEAHSTDVTVAETNLTASSASSTRGRKRKKIFPTAHLPNEERDELHMEIYKYFEWLAASLVASKKGVTTTTTTAATGSERFNDEDDDYDELGMRSRKKKERSARGCGDGISISSLNQMMKFMESTFKVIGHSQRTSQPVASLLSSSNTSSTTMMPLLEEALSEPLRRLAAIAKRNPENQRSRWKRNRRSSATVTSGGTGIDFEDMFERLLLFQQVCETVFIHVFMLTKHVIC